jgi:hypothetical protein
MESDKPVTKKSFKDYEPGFLHMDIKYLPHMPDEAERRYLFVAFDRATCWVFMEIYANQSDNSSFNGRISEIVNQTRFSSRAELESTRRNYLKIDNNNIPQRAQDNETPIQAMKKWLGKSRNYSLNASITRLVLTYIQLKSKK